MRGNYVIGCPGVQWWEYGLMLMGFILLLFVFTFAYQYGAEKIEFYRTTRRRRLAEAEGD